MNTSQAERLTSIFGQFSFFAKNKTSAINTIIIATPIIIPSVNMLETEAPVSVQYRTIIIDGGIIGPKPPETTRSPAMSASG